MLALLAMAFTGTIMAAPDAHAQAAGTPVTPAAIPLVGAVSPAYAVNVLGTPHTVTFTCTATGGCGIVTVSVTVAALGIPTSINQAACSAGPAVITGSMAICTMALNDTLSVTINPGGRYVYLISFSGSVPVAAGAACPAGTTLNPGGTTCAFAVVARKAYVDIVELRLVGGPCGGAVVFSQTLDAFLGPACNLTAAPVGLVIVEVVADCAAELDSLAGTTPPVDQYGTGASWICSAGLLAVAGITASGLTAAGIPNALADLPIVVRLTGPAAFSPDVIPPAPSGTCTGVGGATSLTVPADTPFSICPTGSGTVTVQGCLVTTINTQPVVCSSSFHFTYTGCPAGSVCIAPVGGACPPGYAEQGSPPVLCVTNVPTVKAAIVTALGAAGVTGPGQPGGNSYMKQLDAVQQALDVHQTDLALADLQSLLCHVRAQSGKQIPTQIAGDLQAEISLFYMLLGGSAVPPAC